MNVDWQRAINGLRGAGIRTLVFALLAASATARAADAPPTTSFVKTSGTAFTVDGKPFFVTGVNNHYLTFGSKDEVIGVLDDDVAMGANVVRTFRQPVIGSLDGKVATIWNWHNGADASDLGVGGAYLLYWDPHEGGMAINDSPNGMENVDFQDHNHLVGSGHANVDPKLSGPTTPTLDFGTWHGYPLYYNLTVREFNNAITEFCGMAGRADKPVLLEEFGSARSNRDSAEAYALWLDTLARDSNCAGWLVWRLVSRQDSGRYPVGEHDQFDIRNDESPIGHVLQDAAARRRTDGQSRNSSKNLRETP
jgi:hypothetical protein